ncbi:MAG TPA: hypothetical protein ENJ30_12625 [Desulfobulbaceae bacterium]|nr:hypothetical protein [Desulfobulbaceae bacterium]
MNPSEEKSSNSAVGIPASVLTAKTTYKERHTRLKEAVANFERLKDALPAVPEGTLLPTRRDVTGEVPDRVKALAREVREGRVGSAMFPGYPEDPPASTQVLEGQCLCGSPLSVTTRELHRQLKTSKAGAKQFFAPFDGEDCPREAFPCRHLRHTASSVHRPLYRVWANMRTAAVKALEEGQDVAIHQPWFDKELGFARFVIDAGIKPQGSHKLVRTGEGFTPADFEWQKTLSKTNSEQRLAYNRFYALRRDAEAREVPLHWKTAAAFSEWALEQLSEQFPGESIKDFRLSWKEADTKGFTPENYRFVRRLHRGKAQARKKKFPGPENFAGVRVDSEEKQLMSMRFIEVLLDTSLPDNVEEALDRVLLEFGKTPKN